MTPEQLQAGQVLHVTATASVQFATRPIVFRIIHVKRERSTYHGWIWLDGYQLDATGAAVERREIWVQPAGLRLLDHTRAARQRQLQAYATRNAGPQIPRPRTTTDTTTPGRTR